MAHHKSALKRIRQTIKRTARNRSERSSLRTSVKKYREVLAGGDQVLAKGEYPEIQKKIDKAVTKTYRNMKPSFIIAHTIKGKGVSFMENRPLWHGSVKMTNDQIKSSLKELGASKNIINDCVNYE